MKKFVILAIAFFLSLGTVATPALAGEKPTRSYSSEGPQNENCFGSFCSGDTLTVTMAGGVTRVGTAGGMFDAGDDGIGEAGAVSNGKDAVDLGMYINTCGEGNCDNRLTATLTGVQENESYAWGMSEKSGIPVVASSLGISGVVMDFQAGINACPGGCPPANNGSND